MSETNETEFTDNDIAEYEERRERLHPDDFLGALVNIANDDPKVALGITLTVGGTVICGTLKGRRPWVAEMVDAYGEPASFATQFGNLWAKQDAEEDVPEMPTYAAFIHLVDAHILSGPSPIPSGAGLFWRGRLSEVSGWSLGLIEIGKQD